MYIYVYTCILSCVCISCWTCVSLGGETRVTTVWKARQESARHCAVGEKNCVTEMVRPYTPLYVHSYKQASCLCMAMHVYICVYSHGLHISTLCFSRQSRSSVLHVPVREPTFLCSLVACNYFYSFAVRCVSFISLSLLWYSAEVTGVLFSAIS